MLIDRPLWNSVLFLLHVNIARYFYFLVTKGNLTLALVFYKGVNSISADESSLLVPTRCLLSLVSNGNLILLFFIGEQIQLQLSSYQLLFPGY